MAKQNRSTVPSSLRNVRQRIRAAGLRSTAARIAVLRHMITAASPRSHAQVADDLEEEGFDRATIYRNLVELSEVGLLNRMELGDHVWRFEIRTEGTEDDEGHPHFVCVSCGTISCLHNVEVNINPRPGTKKSGIGRVTTVMLKGECGVCSN